jgi:dihydropteroate synthase
MEADAIPVAPGELGEAARSAWPRPLGLLSGGVARDAVARGLALPLAGGPIAFTAIELLGRRGGDVVAAMAPLAEARALADPQKLAALSAARAPWAGFALDRPLVMGILNVTPDSFSDGGVFLAPDSAIARGRALMAAGADILDIGGESTRPGALPVPADEEIRRIAPVVRGLAEAGAVISIDTRKTAVMAAALAHGARIVNDVSALADEGAMALAARAQAPVVLMHRQGEPATMQRDPRYALASLDIVEWLAARIALCEAAGIPRARIVVDPGIGFGKTRAHNLEILRRLALFQALGCGVLVGLSRKSLVGGPAGERLPGSLAGALFALSQGAQLLRVHDVAETRQAVEFWRAI